MANANSSSPDSLETPHAAGENSTTVERPIDDVLLEQRVRHLIEERQLFPKRPWWRRRLHVRVSFF